MRAGRKSIETECRLWVTSGPSTAPSRRSALWGELAQFGGRYNLAYLDRRPFKESFQPQIGLTMFLMSQVAETPRLPEELLAITALPIDPPQSDFPFRPETVYHARVLRYLEWFGLLEKVRIAANDQVGEQHLYRKTPLFDRFLSFDIEALIS